MSEFEHEHAQHEPVLVRIVDPGDKIDSADIAGFMSFPLGGTEQPLRLLANDQKRRRAVIAVLPGFLNNNTLGNVYLGRLGQVSNRQGFIAVSGMVFELQSKQEVWLAPDGTNSLTVCVIDERYE